MRTRNKDRKTNISYQHCSAIEESRESGWIKASPRIIDDSYRYDPTEFNKLYRNDFSNEVSEDIIETSTDKAYREIGFSEKEDRVWKHFMGKEEK